ncbi:hypothetical protein GGI21_003627, partial [Coemansia aciculifera]
MSAASRTRSATRHHNRSSSAGSSLVDAKSATRRAVAQTAQAATTMAAEGSMPSAMFALPPPARNDHSLSAISSSDSGPGSPTDSVAARSRAANAGDARSTRSMAKPGTLVPKDVAVFNEGRRASSHSIHAHARRMGNESPISFMRSSRKSGGAASLASFTSSGGGRAENNGEHAVDITGALMESLVERTRDHDKMREKYESEIAQLKDELLRTRRQSVRAPTDSEFQLSVAPAAGNMFSDPEGGAARTKILAHAMELDKAALDKFDEFRKSYEDCEPSLRSNRAQFSGERPLSPPPARSWGGGLAVIGTPMRLADSSADHEARLASLNAAEVRRAGEDLMSTPVRRKTLRTIRASSVRRQTKSRMNRPIFGGGGDSDMSDDGVDLDDDFDDDLDDHRDLRNCLMSASKFGTFLVQYVTRQCLDYNTLCDEKKMLLVRHDELEKRMAQLEKLNKRLEESRDDQAAQTYDISAQRELLVDKVDAAERSNRRLLNENDKLKNDLVASNERGVGLDDQVTKLNASLVKTRQRYEQEIANLRRSSNVLQQDKTTLAKKNDELRVELRGKLQRAGLKANVD